LCAEISSDGNYQELCQSPDMLNFPNFAASFRLWRISLPEHPLSENVYGDFISNGWQPKRPKIIGLENIYDSHTPTHMWVGEWAVFSPHSHPLSWCEVWRKWQKLTVAYAKWRKGFGREISFDLGNCTMTGQLIAKNLYWHSLTGFFLTRTGRH